jgi:uncharacterized protein (UPF0264 family)
MTGLLVSVRDAEEARTALVGGASLIDVKDPARGALGRAEDSLVRAVVAAVAGQAPVSAAMGELLEAERPPEGVDLAFAKWGLSGTRDLPWQQLLLRMRDSVAPVVVPCAYAEQQSVGSPAIQTVLDWMISEQLPILLIDTFLKDGRTLVDHLSLRELQSLAERCRIHRVQLALAGSLSAELIARLASVHPAWFAVRGAACGGSRNGRVERECVNELVREIQKLPLQEGTSSSG